MQYFYLFPRLGRYLSLPLLCLLLSAGLYAEETTAELFTCDQIACPNEYEVECLDDANPDYNNVNQVPHFENKCDPPTLLRYEDDINYNPDNPAYGAVITRTWYGTSQNGIESSCTMKIFVLDTDPPLPPTPPGDLAVDCAEDVPLPDPLFADDDCDGQIEGEVREVITEEECVNRYTLIRIWTFTDRLGNQSSVSQTITVNDLIEPLLIVPADVFDLSCTASLDPANTGEATANDNCSGRVLITHTDKRVNVEGEDCYALQRTWKATDACGNETTGLQTIYVTDDEAPTFKHCPADVTVNSMNDVPPVAHPQAEDNCDTDVEVTYNGEEVDDSCEPEETTITRSWTATDNCGNTAECVQVITVKSKRTNDCYSIRPTVVYSSRYNATKFTWKVCLIGDDCKDISNIRFSLPCGKSKYDIYKAYSSLRGLKADVKCDYTDKMPCGCEDDDDDDDDKCEHDKGDRCKHDKDDDCPHDKGDRCDHDDEDEADDECKHRKGERCRHDEDDDCPHKKGERCNHDDDKDRKRRGDKKSYGGDDDDDDDDDCEHDKGDRCKHDKDDDCPHDKGDRCDHDDDDDDDDDCDDDDRECDDDGDGDDDCENECKKRCYVKFDGFRDGVMEHKDNRCITFTYIVKGDLRDHATDVLIKAGNQTGLDFCGVTPGDCDPKSLMTFDEDPGQLWGPLEAEPLQPVDATSIAEVSVFPNPARDLISLRFESAKDQRVNLQVYDATGRVTFSRALDAAPGSNTVELSLGDVPAGLYQMVLTPAEGERTVRSFLRLQ